MNLTSLVESGAKDLGPRFNLVGVLPTVMLFLFILALYWSGAPTHAPDVRAVVERVELISGKEGIVLALGVLLFALLMQPLQLSLVRMLEGYWNGLPFIGARLAKIFIDRHKERRGALERQTHIRKRPEDLTEEDVALAAAADWQLSRSYPAKNRVMPTALGNSLRAAEDVPYERYGLDAIIVWPRLYPLLPQSMTDILADRRNQLDVAARFCAIFILCAGISIFFLYPHGWWLVVPAFMLLLAWLSYRGAVAAAVAYGESIQSAFDLYRFELHKALHLPSPRNLQAEKRTNLLITNFLRQGITGKFELLPYESPAPKK